MRDHWRNFRDVVVFFLVGGFIGLGFSLRRLALSEALIRSCGAGRCRCFLSFLAAACAALRALIPEIDLAVRLPPKSSARQKEELAKSSCSFSPQRNWTSIIAATPIAFRQRRALRYISLPGHFHQNFGECHARSNTQRQTQRSIPVKKVLALLFLRTLSISLSSFAFAQNDKRPNQPADKTGQPADKRDGTSPRRTITTTTNITREPRKTKPRTKPRRATRNKKPPFPCFQPSALSRGFVFSHRRPVPPGATPTC